MSEPEDQLVYQVLINDEEQYSLWPDQKKVPLGWRQVYGPADKEACLIYVRENWTDMRPLSVRKSQLEMIQKHSTS